MGGFIIINKEKEDEDLRKEMRRGMRQSRGDGRMDGRRHDAYREGYKQGYKHGWQDAENGEDEDPEKRDERMPFHGERSYM
jgi:hypothetical protein